LSIIIFFFSVEQDLPMSTGDINTSEARSSLEAGEGAGTSSADKTANKNHLAIIVAFVALYILWGATYLGMRIALQSFPPFLLAGIRFLIAGVLMFVFLLARGAVLPTRKEWLGSALIGGLLLLCGNGGVVFAEQWVSSGLSAVAVGAVPLWAALLVGLSGRWPSRPAWCGLIVGFVGLILLNLGNNFLANPLGMIVLIIAPFCWALGSVLSQRVPLPQGAMASAAQLLCGGMLLCLVGLSSGERLNRPLTLPAIWAMLFLIIGGSLVAFTAYGYLLKHVQASLATSYAYVNPVVAVALGIWLAGEQITLFGVIAIAVILGGVVLVTSGARAKKAKS
jgi:drug/metabolite transporter (DMT)-like permease